MTTNFPTVRGQTRGLLPLVALILVIPFTSLLGVGPWPALGALAVLVGCALMASGMPAPAVVVPIAVGLLYANAPLVVAQHIGVPPELLGLATMGLVGLAALRVLLVDRLPIAVPAALPWLLLYAAAVTLSSILSEYPEQAFMALIAFLGEGLLVYVLVVNAVRDMKTLRRTLWTVAAVAAVLAVLSVYQAITSSYETDFLGFSGARLHDDDVGALERIPMATGPIGQQNRWAQFLLMVLPIPLVTAMKHPRVAVRIDAATLALSCAAGVLLTASRGAMVAATALFVTMILMREVRTVGLVIVAVGVAVMLTVFPRALDRLTSTVEAFQSSDPIAEVDGAVIGRLSSNIGAVRVFSEHPITGVGLGNYPSFHRDAVEDLGLRVIPDRQPHNLYPQIGAESGVVGLVPFTGILIATLAEVWRTRQRTRRNSDLNILATAMFLAVLAYLYAAMFLHLAFQRYFWLLLGLTAAVTVVAREPQDVTPGDKT